MGSRMSDKQTLIIMIKDSENKCFYPWKIKIKNVHVLHYEYVLLRYFYRPILWMKKALFINLLGAVVARLYDRNRIATLVEQLAYCLRFVGKIRVVAT